MTGPPRLPPLKLLQQALRLEGSRGLCFHRSAAFVFDVPGAVMMLGTLTPPGPDEVAPPGASDVPFIHGWAEYRGFVYAPTTLEAAGGRLLAIDRATYYAVNGVHDVRSLTRAQLLRLDRRLGLKYALRRGGPCRSGASFGGSLLEAAGIAWQPTPDGGTIPAHVDEGV